ncbi:hypothetical protein V1477_021335 [Vespula maculifrons]|uniref:Uncharacterized protein n=1 Tax=Vespula maculifrons TaxID=7453 RepID=A0ABD2AHH5_VESMC
MKWVFKTKRGYALVLSEIRLSLCYGTIVISFPKNNPENFWIRIQIILYLTPVTITKFVFCLDSV